MFDIDRILAIPDESVDYLQCGISGGERAALEKRGFIRTDGTKAKDYMIRTIQKTAKNKAKAEKAVIKGDKPLNQGAEEFKLAMADKLKQLLEIKRENYRLKESYDPEVAAQYAVDDIVSMIKNSAPESQLEMLDMEIEDSIASRSDVLKRKNKSEKPIENPVEPTKANVGKIARDKKPKDRSKTGFDVNKSLSDVALEKGVTPPSSGFGGISSVQASIGRSNSMSGLPSPIMRDNARQREKERDLYNKKFEPIKKEYKEKAIKSFNKKEFDLYDAFTFFDSQSHYDLEGKPSITAWDVLSDEFKTKGIQMPSPFSLAKLKNKQGDKAVKEKLREIQKQYFASQPK